MMRLLYCGCLLALALSAGMTTASVSFARRTIDGATVYVVQVDLRNPHFLLTPLTACHGLTTMPFSSFFSYYAPVAQITGSFFDLKTGWPVGDINIDGKPVYHDTAHRGAALVIGADRHIDILDHTPGGAKPWAKYQQVLQGGCRLLRHGKYACNPRRDGFQDTFFLRDTPRIAVGLRAGQRVLLVGVPSKISLKTLATILLRLGCRDAMALDGGTSSGFAYKETILMNTARPLCSVLAVLHDTPEVTTQRPYHRRTPRLHPAAIPRGNK